MTSISAFNLFKTKCAGGCGKIIKTFATSRSGDLPNRFCGGVCETTYKNQQRFYKKTVTRKYDNFFNEKKPTHVDTTYNYDVTTGEER
jgi:hypothetical protein